MYGIIFFRSILLHSLSGKLGKSLISFWADRLLDRNLNCILSPFGILENINGFQDSPVLGESKNWVNYYFLTYCPCCMRHIRNYMFKIYV